MYSKEETIEIIVEQLEVALTLKEEEMRDILDNPDYKVSGPISISRDKAGFNILTSAPAIIRIRLE